MKSFAIAAGLYLTEIAAAQAHHHDCDSFFCGHHYFGALPRRSGLALRPRSSLAAYCSA
jgi:hypothetical protein